MKTAVDCLKTLAQYNGFALGTKPQDCGVGSEDPYSKLRRRTHPPSSPSM